MFSCLFFYVINLFKTKKGERRTSPLRCIFNYLLLVVEVPLELLLDELDELLDDERDTEELLLEEPLLELRGRS